MLVRLKYYHAPKINVQDRSFEDYYFRTVERLSLLTSCMNFLLLIMCILALAFSLFWVLLILLLYNKKRIYISKTT